MRYLFLSSVIVGAALVATCLVAAPREKDPLLSPADAVAAAWKDAQTLPEGIQPLTRYLSLYNIPPQERADAAKVLSFHANSLSREPDIVPPALVAEGTLLRINLADYGWDAKTWDKLAATDPYFHILVQTEETFEQEYGHYAADSRFVVTETRPEKRQVRKAALAPWLAETDAQKEALAGLVKGTHSQGPVLRADWFFRKTAIQEGDQVGYYDFLGVGKKQADFEQVVGADLDLAKRLKKEMAGAVLRSTVALNNRRLVRFGTVSGSYWATLDAKTSVDKRNFARVLDDGFAFDATEIIASLPDGLHGYFLVNAKGERQDTAPDFIASDSTASGTDRRVHAGLSCVRCHGPVAGIQEIDDWVRQLVAPPLALQSPDYDQLRRLRQLYLSDLGRQVQKDQEQYTEAVKLTNGLTPQANARLYARWWDRYQEQDFDLARIEREVGVPRDQVVAALKEINQKTGSL
ncbi:MAG: hypothetical protein JO112_00765, partial [Planctomycetes bacterium]|nr:hypothetical protein [Planctomycetota bacterium]